MATPPRRLLPRVMDRRGGRLRCSASPAAALVLGFVLEFAAAPEGWTIACMALAVVAGGLTTVRRAVLSVKHRTLDMYVLMVVAVIGAALIGEWFEAATVVVLFGLAQALERRSMDRARRAISTLLNVDATEITIRRGAPGCAAGNHRIPLDAARVADILIVAPGERIALDGQVVSGTSDVNQAPVTGESIPVTKEPGDRVFAGTINGHGALDVQVTAVGDDTTLARIIHLVERAQAQRAPSQAWVDRFAHRYTPIVLILASLVAIVPPLAFERAVRAVDLSRARAAGDRVSVRAGHLDARLDRFGTCRGGAARRVDQGRRCFSKSSPR